MTGPGTNVWCLGGGPLADGNGVFFERGGLLIQGDRILEAGDFEAVASRAGRVVDTGGRLILPGGTNFHHHLYSFFAPGISPKGRNVTFQDILDNLWWPLDAALEEETVYWSALAGLLESIRCGVTTVFDHHASLGRPAGSLGALRRAFETAGLRGVLCFETSDRRGKKEALGHIEENLSLHASLSSGAAPLLRSAMGLHANFTLSAETLAAVVRAKPKDMPIHIHCGEAPEDAAFCRAQGFAGPVDRLASFGLLDQDSLLIHCVHLSDRDFAVLREISPHVVVNPESNANNGVGFPDFSRLPGFLIGTDGMTGDMIASWRSAHLLCASRGLDFGLLGKAVFTEGIRTLERFFPGTGTFRPGNFADAAVLEYAPLSPLRESNLLGHLLFGAKSGRAWLTLCRGEVLWENGGFPHLDEKDILDQAGRAAKHLHERYYG